MKNHSKSYLMSWSKKDLVEHIMCLEHNLDVERGLIKCNDSFFSYMSDEENFDKTCRQVQKEWCEKTQKERMELKGDSK